MLTNRQIATRLSNAAKVFGLNYTTIDGLVCSDAETAGYVAKHLETNGNETTTVTRIDPVSQKQYTKVRINY